MREVSSIAFSQLFAADDLPRGRVLLADCSMTPAFMAEYLLTLGQCIDRPGSPGVNQQG